jgi:hypothetical protein
MNIDDKQIQKSTIIQNGITLLQDKVKGLLENEIHDKDDEIYMIIEKKLLNDEIGVLHNKLQLTYQKISSDSELISMKTDEINTSRTKLSILAENKLTNTNLNFMKCDEIKILKNKNHNLLQNSIIDAKKYKLQSEEITLLHGQIADLIRSNKKLLLSHSRFAESIDLKTLEDIISFLQHEQQNITTNTI